MKPQSQIFNFGRFADCLKRDLTLNGKSWLLKGMMMLGVTTLLLLFVTNPGMHGTNDYAEMQEKGCFLIFRFCGVTFCALGASLFMENMTSNGSRLNSLMSPASDLEKYLSRFLISIVGGTVAFLICFAIADAIRILIISQRYDNLSGLSYIGPFKVQSFSESLFYLWGSFVAFQATFVLGSTIWPKNAFLKTFGSMIVLLIILVIVGNNVYTLAAADGNYWPSESALRLLYKSAKILPSCWALFCYITAYYRFKESEIINRY